MKTTEYLLKLILKDAMKLKDIAFLRKIFESEKSDKKVRLELVKRMVENSEDMKEYINSEKIASIMLILAGKLNWQLVFAVIQKQLDEKKLIVGWNGDGSGLIEEKTAVLRKEFFNELGKCRFNVNEEEFDKAFSILERAATEIFQKIEKEK